ncbi:MAG TPA: exopolysaccharide biosynthesis polyprenyl glycosylphosphotransferase [Spirochaetota bacterium]|nr:exopolysaccharide biosynthesis polyprenyl glycosylphosphotransferase [Spirochaetota bacterium]
MRPVKRRSVVLLDISLFTAAFLLALQARARWDFFIFTKPLAYTLPSLQIYIFISSVFAYIFLFYIMGLYEINLKVSFINIFIKSTVVSMLIFSWFLLFPFITQQTAIPRSILSTFLIFNLILFYLHRYIRLKLLRRKIHKVAVIGEPAATGKLLQKLRSFNDFQINITGLILPPGRSFTKKSALACKVLGTWKNLNRLIKKHNIDVAFIAAEKSSQKQAVLKQINYNTYKKTFIYMTPNNYEIMMLSPEYFRINDIALIRINKTNQSLFTVKRIFDLIFGLLLFFFLIPLMALTWVLIKITSHGPAVFAQERIGKHQQPFRMYKFRTMYAGSEKQIYKAGKKKDKRITPVGRILRITRIDELPQLLNIINGTMSFIGPRPLVKKEVRKALKTIPRYEERFSVLPGITGLAQVHGDYYTKGEDKIKYDLWYVFHYSFYLDLLISFKTLQTILLRKGS